MRLELISGPDHCAIPPTSRVTVERAAELMGIDALELQRRAGLAASMTYNGWEWKIIRCEDWENNA